MLHACFCVLANAFGLYSLLQSAIKPEIIKGIVARLSGYCSVQEAVSIIADMQIALQGGV